MAIEQNRDKLDKEVFPHQCEPLSASMKSEQIQTLHPQAGKTNKKISLDKYLFIKDHLVSILGEWEPTHTELMEALFSRVNNDFEGGVQWYGETVKLDLEARGIIERTKTKPERYKLTVTTLITNIQNKHQ